MDLEAPMERDLEAVPTISGDWRVFGERALRRYDLCMEKIIAQPT
jgi:hypothetical protein